MSAPIRYSPVRERGEGSRATLGNRIRSRRHGPAQTSRHDPDAESTHDGAIKLTSALDPAPQGTERRLLYPAWAKPISPSGLPIWCAHGYDASDTYGRTENEIPGGAA